MTSEIERRWLEREEKFYKNKIYEELKRIDEDNPHGYKMFVEEVLENKINCSKDLITSRLFSVLRKDQELNIE